MATSQIIFHIIYVHGFLGDHTTFQSFPTDLHKALLPQLPTNIDLRSILYPTYKSRRPISEATQKFLNWLDALPHGPVILCGHSMGGLLIAEAATSTTHSAAKRVVALVAFDVPFLGMHPHVVISGIASLLPNSKKGELDKHGTAERGDPGVTELKSEREVNDSKHVSIPADDRSRTPSPSPSKNTVVDQSSSSTNLLTVPSSGTSRLPTPPSHDQWPPLLPERRSPYPTPAIVFRALNFIESHSNNALVRFLSKHRSDPLGATKRWIVESFEFGVCMFDPKGLRDRYSSLQQWNKPWVAFWTETMPGAQRDNEIVDMDIPTQTEVREDSYEDGLIKERAETESLGRLLGPTLPLTVIDDGNSSSPSPFQADSLSPLPQPSSLLEHELITNTESGDEANTKETAEKGYIPKENEDITKALRKQQEKELKLLRKQRDAHAHSPHHFVVRPFKPPPFPRHRWELVKIRGAKDEVGAHTGLFLPDVNWDYPAFVERVSLVVKEWVVEASTCET